MAGQRIGNSGAQQLPQTNEKKDTVVNVRVRIPRRKLTLITISLLLNILHWSSFICLFTSIFQITSSPEDKTSVPSEILTLLSAIVTITYTYLHTIISLKQKIWMHQRRHSSAIKKTSYIAIRFAISLCIIWLFTVGWDMITVARRPTCLPEAPGLQAWEVGSVCAIARLGMAFAVISLVASCILFGVLGAVRRPFEAHLFKNGYRQAGDPFATPNASRGPSPVRPVPRMVEKQTRGRRRSISSRRSISDSDVETLDLSHSPPPPTIHSPSPQRSVGLGIFTSNYAPPPIPPEYMNPLLGSSVETLPPFFHPYASHRGLTRPPRLSGYVSTSGFVPLSIAPQYSASTWRALHPISPSSLRPTSRSQPHLPTAGFSHRSRFSRSSVSLTRPHRISTATPNGSVAWSSRSGSSGPEGRGTPASGDEDRRAPANEIAYAILNGTPIPGTTRPQTRGKGHKRTASAPDATAQAEEALKRDRMAMGWKPHLISPTPDPEEQSPLEFLSMSTKLARIVRSSSAELLSRFSPDSSVDNDDIAPALEVERNSDLRPRIMKELPFRRSRSAGPVTHPDVSAGAGSSIVDEAAKAMVKGMPEDLVKTRHLHSEPERRRKTWFEEAKNKPLPKIAILW